MLMKPRILLSFTNQNQSNVFCAAANNIDTNALALPRSSPLSLNPNFPCVASRWSVVELYLTLLRSFREFPPPHVLASLVDTYFSRIHNQPYSFFHEQSFRQKLADNVLPDYLKLAVIAIALRFSEDPYYNGAYHEACTSYARESWKQIVSLWFALEAEPDIHICQAVTLLSIIDFTGNQSPLLLMLSPLITLFSSR
jgi:hypothetical protein